MNIYRQLAEGGGYNLPFLVHLSSPDNATHIYLINDNQDMTFGGHTYAASNFTYTPNNTGDSSFSVEIVEHDEIIDILEKNDHLQFEIIGVFNGEEVQPISVYKHKYGSVEWNGMKAIFKLNKDDRGGMTFPALIFNSYNNRGNN